MQDLTSQPNLDKLRGIVSGARPGKEMLANTIWGEITWSAQLGRPAHALSSGFDLTLHVVRTETRVEGNSEVPFELNEPRDKPFMWDGAEQNGHFRVLFMASGATKAANPRGLRVDNPNVFGLKFAPGVSFQGAGPLAPPGVNTIVPETARVVLNEGDVGIVEFSVVRKRPGLGG